LRDSWQGGDGCKVNSCNFRRQRSSLFPASSFLEVAFSLQLYNSPLYSTVNVNAVLGGGWPRWQPLNVAVAKPYWQDASQRVFWQAATGTAADSCDRTTVALIFWLGGQLAVEWYWFSKERTLNSVVFVFALMVMFDFNRSFCIFSQ
jgi:hypothetical protein